YRCLPLKLRVGVGIGVIDPATLSVDNSWDMNGEAFFLARNALDKTKSGQEKTPTTIIASQDHDFEVAVNAIYRLIDLILNKWTAKQWETVHAYENNETLMKTAAVFNVSWQNIQKICKAANWDAVSQTEIDLAYLLKKQFDLV
ncbi:MAG TPA: SatD family protein, partial [Bacillota bacterium]|nr:SatD family protein [Bacillota bacterium]